jgi:hypothetical protein
MRPLTYALVLLALTVSPQQTDFSGNWAVEAPPQPVGGRAGRAPGTPADLGSGWGSTLTIAQTADTLSVEYVFFATYDLQPPLKFTFALDGRETLNTVMMGRGFQEEESTTKWEGQALVITTRYAFDDPATGKPASFDVTRRLSLESPDTLIVETGRAGALGGPPSSTRVVYKRAPPAG